MHMRHLILITERANSSVENRQCSSNVVFLLYPMVACLHLNMLPHHDDMSSHCIMKCHDMSCHLVMSA